MIRYKEYNPNKANNCIIRSFSLIFGLDCEKVEENLKVLAKKMEKEDYSEIEVFEKYLEDNDFEKFNYSEDICIRELDLEDGTYCVFCTDKKDYYHMVAIHDGVIYDKKDSTLDLYPITIYKSKRILWKNQLNKDIKTYRVNFSRIKGMDNYGTKYIIPANEKFNFPCILFIPDSINENSDLLVGIQTVDSSNDTFDNTIDNIINYDYEKRQDTINGTNIKLGQEFNSPILVPIIPRTVGCDATYLGYEFLDDKFEDAKSAIQRNATKFTVDDYKKFIDLDIQVIEMIKYCQKMINEKANISINEKVILNGYSATSHFVNFFSARHPNECLMVIGGGCGGCLIIPKSNLGGKELSYPVGVSNISFDMEAFANIFHFYYLGNDDNSMGPATPNFELVVDYIDENGVPVFKKDKFNNVIPVLNPDGTIKYILNPDGTYQVGYHDGYYTEEQINILNGITQDAHELFDYIGNIYKENGINCVFNREYKGDHYSVCSNEILINDIVKHYNSIKKEKYKSI